MKLNVLIFLFFFFSIFGGYSQMNLDSLRANWENESLHDTIRMKSLGDLSINGYLFNNPDSAYFYAQLGVDFAINNGYEKYHAKFLSIQGVTFDIQGDGESAVGCYKKSIAIHEQIGNKEGVASVTNNLGVYYYNTDQWDLALESFQKSLDILKELDQKGDITEAYNNIGAIYSERGDDSLSVVYITLGLEGAIEAGDDIGTGQGYCNLAIKHQEKGRYKISIELLNKGLAIFKKINNQRGMVLAYNSLGQLYKSQGNLSFSLEYYVKCLEISQSMGNKLAIAFAYSNIGNIYSEQKDYIKALDFYQRSLVINKGIDKVKDVADLYLEIGAILLEMEYEDFNTLDLESSSSQEGSLNLEMIKSEEEKIEFVEELYQSGLDIYVALESKFGIASANISISKLNYKLEKYPLSNKNALKAYGISQDIGDIHLEKSAVNMLYQSYKKLGDDSNTLKMYEKYMVLKDSVESEENQKAAIQQEYKYKYEVKSTLDSIRNYEKQLVKQTEIEKQNLEIKQSKTQRYYLFAGLVGVLLFAVVLLFIIKKVKLQKKEIENQKEIVDAQYALTENQKKELSIQHKQITDSIDYARNLQKSVLISRQEVNANFNDNFIFYQPKDVVSGDFFWTASTGNLKYLAVADCTGHGVPGAFMTLVANNLLNEIIKDHLISPISIVQELHKRIKLKVGGAANAIVKDSLDIGLISYNQDTNEVKYVGTHFSLFKVSNGALDVIKGDRANIGYNDTLEVKEHSLIVSKGDMLYLHTDGYPDQKGGELGKKFYQKPIREMLLDIHLLNLAEQGSLVKGRFNDWKADKEQIDDVCFVGVRI